MRIGAKSLERGFSFERLGLLIRNRLYDEAPVLLIGAAIVVGLNALSLVVAKTAFFNIDSMRGPSGGFWVLTIFLGGLVMAGSSLKGMHDGRAQTDWLLLPATGVEKYAAALADVLLVFPLLCAAGGIALSGALSLVELLVGGPGNSMWIPDAGSLEAWGRYAAAATVFVAGSASFRKAAFLKTSGIALGFAFLFALALSLLVSWLVGGWKGSVSFVDGRFYADSVEMISERAVSVMQAAFDTASYALVPILAVLFGAAKVGEKEARDEVQ